jgi:transcriptional antiterminator NusG
MPDEVLPVNDVEHLTAPLAEPAEPAPTTEVPAPVPNEPAEAAAPAAETRVDLPVEAAPEPVPEPTPDVVADESTETTAEAEPEEAPAPPPLAPSNKRWYVVKVQSGREESIKEAIERRVKIEGLEEYFGQIMIPVEKVTEVRNGKRVQRTHKLYPGYLMVEVEYNDQILYLFRETSGVGDFVGGSVNRAPPPMPDREVEKLKERMGQVQPGKDIVAKPKFDRGDRVRVKDGTFAGMEGEVKELLEARHLVRVELTIFGRPVPVELEYWQVEII